MRKIIILLSFLLLCNIAYADMSLIQKVEITPLEGGISFNTVTFAPRSITGWVTANSVYSRKSLMILNTSTSDNVFVTGVSGSTATGTVYPRERAIFGAASSLNIYVSANTALSIEIWEIF